MLIAGARRRVNASRQHAPRIRGTHQLRVKLSQLKISRHIIGMLREQRVEICERRIGIAEIRALQRQSVLRERIIRVRRKKCFQFLPS